MMNRHCAIMNWYFASTFLMLLLLSFPLNILVSAREKQKVGEEEHTHTLSDPPVQGAWTSYLDNNDEFANSNSEKNHWSLVVDNSTEIPAKVPGDLVSDLVKGGLYPEPYLDNNFQNTSFCDEEKTWEYRVNFTTKTTRSTTDREEEFLLVLDGIKMGAEVYVNGQLLGITTDQFLRYTFPLSSVLKKNSDNDNKTNTLSIRFDPSILTDGRFMACSGGWDWAPYSSCPKTTDTRSNTFSKGIFKSVYIVQVSTAAITHVVPQTFYLGDYPTYALVDGNHAGFQVVVRVHLWARKSNKGRLTLQGSWGGCSNTSRHTLRDGLCRISRDINWDGGETNVTLGLTANAQQIKLWWPSGTGPNHSLELSKRPLYDIKVIFRPQKGDRTVSDTRRIGFRHFALVTGNDTNPGYIDDATRREGTLFHGLYFRINGVPLWSRGANTIPMDVLEGRLNARAHVQLVQSAVLANMNTLRVWGGGVFLPSAWYDACDEYGILIIHDQMYTHMIHNPAETKTQESEIRHNVRALSSHPSIVIWEGCNECTVKMTFHSSIYATFVMRLVAEEDASRSIWPSSPGDGWKSGVERLTSRPIPGKDLITPDDNMPQTIEVHGPYDQGSGFPTIDGGKKEEVDAVVFDNKIPILIDPKPEQMGVAHQSVFASEFGCGGVMSSFESMSATLSPNHWSLHGGSPPDVCTGTYGFTKQCTKGNAMAQRNYPCDNIITAYFPVEPGYFEQVGRESFRRQLYHCMVGQALQMKNTIEERRSRNELGHLVWQLNEIWPTGGWGSLEYGNPKMQGQVLGGRWKPLHYFYHRSTFRDILATCGGDGVGYIRNDAAGRNFTGNIVIDVINIETGVERDQRLVHGDILLPPGPGSLKQFPCPIINGRTHFLSIDAWNLIGDRQQLESRNTPVLFEPPKDMTTNIRCDSGLNAKIITTKENRRQNTTTATVVGIEVTATVPVALLVVLTTEAHGRFSDNVFSVVGGSVTIDFHPFGKLDLELLRDTLRVEDMAMYHHNHCKEEDTELN